MSNVISEHTRAIVSRSLPMVRQHKDEIISRMEVHLRGVNGDDEAFGQSEAASMILVELLIGQAVLVTERGVAGGLEATVEEHRSLQITGRHYSRFGDALVPVLSDELGPDVPREVVLAWCDTFWVVIRALESGTYLVGR